MTSTKDNQNTLILPNSQEFGQMLRQHREHRGLSIGEISERLKLPARQIEALEKGEYQHLPEPVFIRGFLRSYGRFLDIDETKLDTYLAHFEAPVAVQKERSNYVNLEVKKPFPTWIFGLAVVIAIAYGIYAWQNKSQSDNAKNEQASSSVVEIASNASALSASNLNNNNNIVVKPMVASEVVSASQSNIQAATSNVANSVMGELVINTRYRTMLTVTNAGGEILVNEIVPARSEHRFAQGAPFEVRLGYAIGSTATFNGNEIDIEQIRKGGKTATFTAGSEQNTALAQ